MKLIFKKDDESQISVFQDIDGKEQDFSYVDMIKALIESREMEEPEISEGGFTDAEVTSIKRMVEFINKEICSTDEAEGLQEADEEIAEEEEERIADENDDTEEIPMGDDIPF